MNLEVFQKILGGRTQKQLADEMGVEPMTISKWKRAGVPAERVLDLEELTGVSRHEIRPDIYPVDGRYKELANA